MQSSLSNLCAMSPELEAIAEAFQERIIEKGFVADRYDGTKNIVRSFLGKDAVSVLVSILQEGEDTLTSPEKAREQALKIGQKIAQEFRLFAHHTATKKESPPLLDSDKDIYVFQNNLPIEVQRMKKQYPSPWDRVKLLEEYVQVKDRQGIVRVLHNCFVASEAVDVLMYLKLARSRGEAVHMMNKMQDKVNFFTFAIKKRRSVFQDKKDMYLRFVPEECRNPDPKKQQSMASQSPKGNSPRGIRKAKSVDGSKPTSSNESPSPKFRKAKSAGHTGPLSSPPVEASSGALKSTSTGLTGPKDKAYFENRAKNIRNRLDIIREQRLSANAAA